MLLCTSRITLAGRISRSPRPPPRTQQAARQTRGRGLLGLDALGQLALAARDGQAQLAAAVAHVRSRDKVAWLCCGCFRERSGTLQHKRVDGTAAQVCKAVWLLLAVLIVRLAMPLDH